MLGLRVRETKEVYEGEVTELLPEETENPLGGFGRTISHLVITLKSAKGTKKLRLDPSIYEAIQRERVTVGDVIYIEANTGACKRVGRSRRQTPPVSPRKRLGVATAIRPNVASG